MPIEVKQLLVAQWQGENGQLTSSLVAVSTEGAVYRFEKSSGGWVPYCMDTFEKRERKVKEA